MAESDTTGFQVFNYEKKDDPSARVGVRSGRGLGVPVSQRQRKF
jgi:hypothetical protein